LTGEKNSISFLEKVSTSAGEAPASVNTAAGIGTMAGTFGIAG
jgi:hypothetical protein